MRVGRLAFTALLALALLLVFGCSDGSNSDGDGGSATGSPSPADTAQRPPAPELSPGVSRLSEGTFTATIAPSGVTAFDPISLPFELGAETPVCESFVFAFGWQVVKPAPVAENGLIWRITRDGATEEFARGGSGIATVGCGFMEAQNGSGALMTLSVHYLIGRLD